jgi:Tfp pilus assembly PilM family ATPase
MTMNLPLPSLTGTFAEPIGVSLDARWIRAAQVVAKDGRLTLIGAARMRRAEGTPGDQVPPPTREEAARLFEVLARQGIKSQQVVIAAPSQHASLTAIELPPKTSGAPLEQIAAMELSRLQRLEPGTFELALWELPKGQRPGRGAAGSYIAATATHAQGEALSAGFDAVGVAVTALVPEALTLAKAASISPEARALLSLTWSGMEIVVLNELGKIVYHRALPELGLHRLRLVAKERMSLAPEAVDGALDALAAGERAPDGSELPDVLRPLLAGVSRIVQEHADFVAVEVERSLTYSARFSPDCEQKPILIVGEGAGVPGLTPRLVEQVGLEFSTLSCGEVMTLSPGSARHAGACDLAAAVGASLWTRFASERRVA